MLNLPNLLSFLRAPLALFFFQTNVMYRLGAIALAMISDGLDGYCARKFRKASSFGTILDPLMDKLFVMTALIVFLHEERLNGWEAAALICRDFSLLLFIGYLSCKGNLSAYKVRAIWCGKITTALQFFVLLALTGGVHIPSAFYSLFVLLGILALGELYLSKNRLRKKMQKKV